MSMEEKETGGLNPPALTASSSPHSNYLEFTACKCKGSKFSESMQILCDQICADAESRVEVEKIDENTPAWEYEKDCLNPFKELPPIMVWATIGKRKAFCKTSAVVIKARQKKGKSYSTLAVIKTLINFQQFDSLVPLEKPRLCMVFDMEMAEVDLQTRCRPIYLEIGEENWSRLQFYSMLRVPKKERWEFIMSKVERYNPDIVVLDTVTELCEDYNSSTEAASFGEDLRKLYANRLVFCVIHQNKQQGDTNAKGALGSYVENLCSECYSMSAENGIFSFNLEFARFTSNVDAEPLRFALNDNGEIISCDDIVRNHEARQREDFRMNFEHLFGDDAEVQSSELVSRIVEMEGLQERAAKTKISNAYAAGSLIKNRNGKYVYYRLAPF